MTRLGPLQSPILIGRDEVLELADARLADAAAGRGGFLLVAGEAGIGKSRLMSAIGRMAEGRGFRAAAGELAPQDRDVPAASLLDLARTMARLPAFGDLGRDLLGLLDGAAIAERPQRRLVVFEAVDLIAGASDVPTMLWFDDLQWADDLSFEILAELARRVRDVPMLLVGAYRTDGIDSGSILREWRSRLLTQRLAEEARLGPLSLEQTAVMTTLILATGLPAPRDVVEAVHERSDGVPLYIEELLATIGTQEPADGRAIRELAVPATLEDAILERLRRHSPEAQAVARAGAVIGRCFVPEVLAGMMDVPVESLDAPLQELVDQNVLDPPGLRGVFDYRHQLLRDALYRSVPEPERRRFHARAAEFGASLEGATESHASVHFERAGLRAQAFRAALAGARTAARLSSHREAFELYRRAAANRPADLPVAETAALLAQWSTEAAAIEENEIAERTAGEARDLYRDAGGTLRAASIDADIAGLWRREGRPLDDRIRTIETGLADLAALPASTERERVAAVLWFERARAHLDAAQLDAARDATRRGRVLADAVGDTELVMAANSIEGMVDVAGGDVAGGLATISTIALHARGAGFEDVCVTAYRDAAVMAARVMEYRQAQTWIEEGLRYAGSIEQSHCAHVMRSTGALVAWADGRWGDAIDLAEHAVADRGCSRAAAMARWVLGYASFGRGATERADEHLEAALSFAARGGAIDFLLPALWGIAETHLVAGRPASAVETCERAFAVATESGELALLAPFAVTGVRAYQAAGRPDGAARWADRVAAHLEAVPAFALPAVEHARGLVRLAAGATTAARGSLEASVRGWDSRGRAWEAAWARLDLAGCLMRTNHHHDALTILRDARTAAQQLASLPLLARVDELTRLARGRGAEEEPWRPLTAREFEVAKLVSKGLTNAAIADVLGLSPKTVSAHIEHVLAKLGAGRRAEIATWVARVATLSEPSREAVRPGR